MNLKLCLTIFVLPPVRGQSPVSVTTYHNNNARSGANMNEARLTTANVKVGSFGKLFTLNVDGVVYAQPLYVPGLTIDNVTRNVVFVATENNSVYAFDADTGGNPLWQLSLNEGQPGLTVTPVPDADVGVR